MSLEVSFKSLKTLAILSLLLHAVSSLCYVPQQSPALDPPSWTLPSGALIPPKSLSSISFLGHGAIISVIEK